MCRRTLFLGNGSEWLSACVRLASSLHFTLHPFISIQPAYVKMLWDSCRQSCLIAMQRFNHISWLAKIVIQWSPTHLRVKRKWTKTLNVRLHLLDERRLLRMASFLMRKHLNSCQNISLQKISQRRLAYFFFLDYPAVCNYMHFNVWSARSERFYSNCPLTSALDTLQGRSTLVDQEASPACVSLGLYP